MQNNETKDEWEEKLEVKLQEVQQCQQNNGFDSCTPCDKFFECDLRKSYVLSVYESMNKGSSGGFEF